MNKVLCYSTSLILWICSIAISVLALVVDADGSLMAGQTLMMLSGVVGIWALVAMLAGKG